MHEDHQFSLIKNKEDNLEKNDKSFKFINEKCHQATTKGSLLFI